jgi:hypothetical protein
VIEKMVKWITLIILIVSAISLIVVLQSNYIAQELSARAVSLAIVTGLSSIAVSISFKK